MSHQRLERTPATPASLAGGPEPEAFPAAVRPNRAVDEAYLANGPPDVNNNRKEFESSFRGNAAAAQVQTQ